MNNNRRFTAKIWRNTCLLQLYEYENSADLVIFHWNVSVHVLSICWCFNFKTDIPRSMQTKKIDWQRCKASRPHYWNTYYTHYCLNIKHQHKNTSIHTHTVDLIFPFSFFIFSILSAFTVTFFSCTHHVHLCQTEQFFSLHQIPLCVLIQFICT